MQKSTNEPWGDFDWNQARAFLVTAERGSFSAAARALGQTQPTLSRQVAALEAALGVTLFERIGKSLALTETGQRLLDHVRAMAEGAGRLSLAASGQAQSVEGHVTISASDMMAAYVLPDLVARLRAQAPGIVLTILAANQISDLLRREADIALRHQRPAQAELIARRLPDGRARLYAHPDYLARIGWDGDPARLAGADFIGSEPIEASIAPLRAWGLPVRPEQFVLTTNSAVVAWELVRAGRGIGLMDVSVAEATGGAVTVFDGDPPLTFETWLVTHRELHTSPRIRLVFDLIAEHFARRD